MIEFRRATLCFLISAVWLIGAFQGPAAAQERVLFVKPPDQIVQKLSTLARNYITQARLPDGSYIPPETSEELERPLLPFEEAKFVVDAGMVSGLALWCAMDWENGNFRPLMAWQRSRKKWSHKQLAYMGLLHGVSMATAKDGLNAGSTCTPDHKSRLNSHIAKQW